MAPKGHDLGFGIGIATGYATLGLIGFDNGAIIRRSAASQIWRRGFATRRARARS